MANELYKIYSKLPWAKDMTVDEFWRMAEVSYIQIFRVDEKIVGFIRGISDGYTVIYICDLWVKKKHRGKGIGKGLVDAAIKFADQYGLTLVALTSQVGFYRKCGFTDRDGGCVVRRPKG